MTGSVTPHNLHPVKKNTFIGAWKQTRLATDTTLRYIKRNMNNTNKNLFQYLTIFFRNLISRLHSISISEYKIILKNPQVLKLVTADSISSLGNKITYFALLKKVYDISNGNVVDLGFLTIAQILPFILLGPFAGVLVDRVSRRRVMIIADLCNGIAILALSFINSIETIFAVALIASCFYTFRNPAQNAFGPNLVAKEDIALLNSFNSFFGSFIGIAGSAVGAAVIAFTGVATSFLIDAATFFISAAIIAGIQLNERHLEKVGDRTTKIENPHFKRILHQFKTDFESCVKLIRDSASLKLLLTLEMAISFLFGMQGMLFYLFIRETLQFGNKAELAWGVIMSNLGIGSIIGSVIFGLLIKRYPNRFKLFLKVLLFDGIVLAVFSVNTSFTFSILISFLLGIICAAPLIITNTILQETVVDKNRGKVYSFFSILDKPMVILSVFIGTATTKLITAQRAILLFALLEILTVIVIIYSKTYHTVNQEAENVIYFQDTEITISAQTEQ